MPAVRSRSMAASRRSKTRRLHLRLYVAGHAPNSLRAVASIRMICDEHFPAAHDLEIVDMLEHPQKALVDQVIVTPTLLKLNPLPVQRIVGGLSDRAQVLRLLVGR